MNNTVRPTKKQRELLSYIQGFIKEHGYSPSYREIMNGLDYTSVATVSLHVNNLIRRGHLRKRDRSARSLEVVTDSKDTSDAASPSQADVTQSGPAWLAAQAESRVARLEAASAVDETAHQQAYVLLQAMDILGLAAETAGLSERLGKLDISSMAKQPSRKETT